MSRRARDAPTWKRLLRIFRPEEGELARQMLTHFLWFCAIGLVALGLQRYVLWLERNDGNALLMAVLGVGEEAILIGDVAVFLLRILVVTIHALVHAYLDVVRLVQVVTRRRPSAVQAGIVATIVLVVACVGLTWAIAVRVLTPTVHATSAAAAGTSGVKKAVMEEDKPAVRSEAEPSAEVRR
jgi:hypothetical protein